MFVLCVNKFLGQMNDYLIRSNKYKTQKNVAAIHGIVFPEYCNKFLRLKQSRLCSKCRLTRKKLKTTLKKSGAFADENLGAGR